MIRAIIIDDEQHCINRLSGLLIEHCKDSIHLMDVFASVEKGIIGIKKLQPDLIFLDVMIKDKTGFDLLKELDEINFAIIFTTAFEKFALQAIKFSAIDYLLKPIDESDLKLSVEKLKHKLTKVDTSAKLDVLFNNMQSTSKRICVPDINGLFFLNVSDIIRCQSDVNYTHIYLKDKQKLTVAKTLKEFEEMLVEYNFFRVHNSNLINLSHIKNYVKGKGGYVVMIDGAEIEVSTRRKDDFLKRLMEM
ncbi:MAG: response regulator transcription factor [Bacteroidetes bacterium]|nr:response regulator transcription factor [Bacteroidota bacterium]